MPITHAYYLASGLWLLGLAGVLLRRDARGRALALVMMLVGAATVLVGAARAWALADIHGVAALLFALAGAYAVVLATLHAEGPAELAVGSAGGAREPSQPLLQPLSQPGPEREGV